MGLVLSNVEEKKEEKKDKEKWQGKKKACITEVGNRGSSSKPGGQKGGRKGKQEI